MYVAKVDDRGKASCVYMFDEQLINFDDVFSKSYFMDKSSEKQEIVDFSHRWNHDHKNVIYKNEIMHYAGVILKGILQAPALVVLYGCIVMGAMLLFGSENFYNQIDLYGVEAFGHVRNAVIITYAVSAAVGLFISITTYNNVLYKLIRCIVSVVTFIMVSPVIFDKVFFATSNKVLTLTIIMIVGCLFIRFVLDRLIVNIVRKNTEMLIRSEHEKEEVMDDCQEATEMVEESLSEDLVPVMEKVKQGKKLKQYRKR